MSRILVYHSVFDYPVPRPAGIDCPPAAFRLHMKMLVRSWKTVSLDEVFDDYLVKGRPLPADAVAVTFDDGYMDNFDNAFPVLRTLGIPATIFCVASCLGSTWPASDWDGTDKRMLDQAAMKTMADLGIRFGSHGYSHVPLTRLDGESLRSELVSSREKIEALSGRRIRFLSYPFGSFDDRVKKAVEEAGFDGAFTVWTRYEDRWSLNRLPLHRNDTGIRFRLKLLLYDALKPLAARIRGR